MASYGSTQATATAYVKGGMPVLVEGTYEWDESGAAVTDITVRWANTGKEISKGFEDSLSPRDWEAITDAIAAEC
jgi:hypothetical protein